MTNIGKPYEGKPHVRFDEEGLKYFQPFTLLGAMSFSKAKDCMACLTFERTRLSPYNGVKRKRAKNSFLG